MKRILGVCLAIIFVIVQINVLYAQNKLEFDGQFSAISGFKLSEQRNALIGLQYIPELSYAIPVDSFRFVDFEVQGFLQGTGIFFQHDDFQGDYNIDFYRAWSRYKAKNFEIRLGLQKIDFGAAKLIRPLQWFNEIDPRDPLGLTNGVYAILGRYFFKNNANIWLWGLYGNTGVKGIDVLPTLRQTPEFGGRFQFPIPKGELGISGHHRTARNDQLIVSDVRVLENRIGVDAKWDVIVGLWFEGSYIHRKKYYGILKNQAMMTLGLDYTFGLGNGLSVTAEYTWSCLDHMGLPCDVNQNLTALSISYPFGLFDNLTAINYVQWESKTASYFLNYEHQFSKFVGYLMAYYQPESLIGIQDNPLINVFSGPGIRVMFIYNH